MSCYDQIKEYSFNFTTEIHALNICACANVVKEFNTSMIEWDIPLSLM